MQPLQICIGPIIRIGRESWCLPYTGFFQDSSPNVNQSLSQDNMVMKDQEVITKIFKQLLPFKGEA